MEVSTVVRTGETNGSRQAAASNLLWVATGLAGSLYVTGSTGSGQVVFKVDAAGTVTPFAGGGSDSVANGVAAQSAQLTLGNPTVDAAGNVYLADISYVRRVTPGGTISIFAGTGSEVGLTAEDADPKASASSPGPPVR